jgi:AraC-like DNA-binding protein
VARQDRIHVKAIPQDSQQAVEASVVPSIGGSSVLALFALLERYDCDPEQVARQAGIDWRELQAQEARLDLQDYLRLWDLAYQLAGNPALGLELGQVADVSRMGLVGHIFFNSPTFQQGLEHYVRFYRLVNDAIQLAFETDDQLGFLRFIHLYPDCYCIGDVERTMVLGLKRSRDYIRGDLRLHSVHFQHAKPAYAKMYEAIFACPVYFSAEFCQIVFSKDYLQERIARSNPYLGSAALQYANGLLQHWLKKSLAERVQELINRDLGLEGVDIDTIAEKLHMSRQTLYRKLKSEGLSFQGLLEKVRYHRATYMLQRSALSLSEIAYALGFSDLSAFSRAFKRWSGRTPTEFRDTLLF